MKKIFALLMVLVFSQALAFAAEPGTPEYQKMKEYKKSQRELKDREKANPSSKAQGFWEREASRSGFAGTGAMFGNALTLGRGNSSKEKK